MSKQLMSRIEYVPDRVILVAMDGTEVIGCAELWKPKSTGGPVKFGRFAVLREMRNRQIGKLLLKAVEEYAVEKLGSREVYCHAQKISEYFYERNGYIQYGEEFIDGIYDGMGGQLHIKMKKTLID